MHHMQQASYLGRYAGPGPVVGWSGQGGTPRSVRIRLEPTNLPRKNVAATKTQVLGVGTKDEETSKGHDCTYHSLTAHLRYRWLASGTGPTYGALALKGHRRLLGRVLILQYNRSVYLRYCSHQMPCHNSTVATCILIINNRESTIMPGARRWRKSLSSLRTANLRP